MLDKEKRCGCCKEIKSVDMFYKSNGTVSGFTCYCKACLKIKGKEYHNRPDVKEKHILKCSIYRNNHLEEEKANHKRYKELHRDKVNEHNREYAKKNRSVSNKAQNKWLNSHVEKRIEYNNKRRAYVSNAPGRGVTSDDWLQVTNKYGNKCLACGSVTKRLTLDHVVPISLGGAHDPDNIQPLCKPCNSSKGVKTIDYRPV